MSPVISYIIWSFLWFHFPSGFDGLSNLIQFSNVKERKHKCLRAAGFSFQHGIFWIFAIDVHWDDTAWFFFLFTPKGWGPGNSNCFNLWYMIRYVTCRSGITFMNSCRNVNSPSGHAELGFVLAIGIYLFFSVQCFLSTLFIMFSVRQKIVCDYSCRRGLYLFFSCRGIVFWYVISLQENSDEDKLRELRIFQIEQIVVLTKTFFKWQ